MSKTFNSKKIPLSFLTKNKTKQKVSMLTHSIVYKVFQLLFSHSVVSDSFWPHGLQHARLPCPSPTPRACSNSCPLSWWCHSPSHLLLPASPPVFNLSQYQGLFQWCGSLYQVAKILELQLWYQSYQWIFKVGFLKDRLVWSPCSPRDSQESSPAPQFESISLSFSLLYFHCVLKVVGPTTWAFHYNLAQLPTYAPFCLRVSSGHQSLLCLGHMAKWSAEGPRKNPQAVNNKLRYTYPHAPHLCWDSLAPESPAGLSPKCLEDYPAPLPVFFPYTPTRVCWDPLPKWTTSPWILVCGSVLEEPQLRKIANTLSWKQLRTKSITWKLCLL